MYLFFDSETTGRDPYSRIVQIAWLLYNTDDNLLDSHKYIIKPDGFVIPDDVVKIHGITTEYALTHGVPLENALNKFAQAVKNSKIIVAHNINFDVQIIENEFKRKHIASPFIGVDTYCTMKHGTSICRIPRKGGLKQPKLSELFEYLFNKTLTNSHDALTDAQACAACFFEMQRRNQEPHEQFTRVSHICPLCHKYIFVGSKEVRYQWTNGKYIHDRCPPGAIHELVSKLYPSTIEQEAAEAEWDNLVYKALNKDDPEFLEANKELNRRWRLVKDRFKDFLNRTRQLNKANTQDNKKQLVIPPQSWLLENYPEITTLIDTHQ